MVGELFHSMLSRSGDKKRKHMFMMEQHDIFPTYGLSMMLMLVDSYLNDQC